MPIDPYDLLRIGIVVFVIALPILIIYLVKKFNKDN